MLKRMKIAFSEALGIADLKSELRRISEDVVGTAELKSEMLRLSDEVILSRQLQMEQELRMAGWHADIANRQRKLEATLHTIEVALAQLTKRPVGNLNTGGEQQPSLPEVARQMQRLDLAPNKGDDPSSERNP